MGIIERYTELFQRLLRLRRAERAHPDDRDISTVRAEIERELGDGVLTRSMAAQLLGIHHSSLQRWIDSHDLPLVLSKTGRKGIPVSAVAALYEALNDQSSADPWEHHSRQHRIEPLILESHRYAERLDPLGLIDADDDDEEEEDQANRQRRADRRSLAYHRAVAKRLRRPMVDSARRQIWQWQRDGRIDDRYASAWLEILDRPVPEVRRALSADSAKMRDLRQSSPFAGTLTEAERRKILAEIT